MTRLFGVTLFLSAALLFAVQPLAGKMLVPHVGGAPAAWSACLVFFQAALLAGYAGAHAARRLRPVVQVGAHLGLVLLAVLLPAPRLPADPVGSLTPSGTPIAWTLARLAVATGVPVVLLCATTPALQRWVSWTRGGTANPYVLYAASNLGSLVALVGYPVLVEPYLGLELQGRLWRGAFAGFVVLLATCAAVVLRTRTEDGWSAPDGAASSRPPEPLARARRLRWLLLAFVPSSHLLGVTAAVAADVAAVPMLWVIPLALYLLSFVLVFSPRRLVSHRAVARALPGLALLVVLLQLSRMTLPLVVLLPLHFSTFFASALVCHGELARDRPPVSRLTDYYLTLALGGVLGGTFNALVAPVVFHGVAEYPLALVLACLLRPAPAEGRDASARRRRLDVGLPLALGALTALLVSTATTLGLGDERARVAWMFGLPAVIAYTFVERPLRFAGGLAALLAGGLLYPGPTGPPVHQERTFFGVLRVTRDPTGRFHLLLHGGTVHGRQVYGGPGLAEPLAYYHRSGPAGDVFTAYRARARPPRFGIVGLGTAALCAYARPGDVWEFYEIDAAVERIATDPAYFTFWRDCPTRSRRVVLGDARLGLAGAADAAYGMVVLDAFSSGAVPVHLLTREALRLYSRKLAPGGWLVFHVSSDYLRLDTTLAALARDAGLAAYARDDLVLDDREREAGKDPSRWVVMARRPSDLGTLAESPGWRRLESVPEAGVWTDDFSSVWDVVRWR